jgi:hypothetical protein
LGSYIPVLIAIEIKKTLLTKRAVHFLSRAIWENLSLRDYISAIQKPYGFWIPVQGEPAFAGISHEYLQYSPRRMKITTHFIPFPLDGGRLG